MVASRCPPGETRFMFDHLLQHQWYQICLVSDETETVSLSGPMVSSLSLLSGAMLSPWWKCPPVSMVPRSGIRSPGTRPMSGHSRHVWKIRRISKIISPWCWLWQDVIVRNVIMSHVRLLPSLQHLISRLSQVLSSITRFEWSACLGIITLLVHYFGPNEWNYNCQVNCKHYHQVLTIYFFPIMILIDLARNPSWSPSTPQ